jgi:hypothetical protein
MNTINAMVAATINITISSVLLVYHRQPAQPINTNNTINDSSVAAFALAIINSSIYNTIVTTTTSNVD